MVTRLARYWWRWALVFAVTAALTAALAHQAVAQGWPFAYPVAPTGTPVGYVATTDNTAGHVTWSPVPGNDAGLAPGTAGQILRTNTTPAVQWTADSIRSGVIADSADPTGSADSSADILNCLTGSAANNLACWLLPGTYKIASNIAPPAFGMLSLSPEDVLNSTIASSAGPAPANAPFFGTCVQRAGYGGSLSTTPQYYVEQPVLSVLATNKPLVGDWVQLVATGSSQGGSSTYLVTNVTGASSPWNVIVDRPVVFPFLAGDTVNECQSIPHDFTIAGNNAYIQGTGDQSWEFVGAINIKLDRLGYQVPIAGTPAIGSSTNYGSVGGFDIGTVRSVLSDSYANVENANYITDCYYMQSAENTVFQRDRCRGVGTGANPGNAAYIIFDSYSSGSDSSWAYGGNAALVGFRFSSLGAASHFGGNIQSFVRGGGCEGVGTCVAVDYATGTIVDGIQSIGAQTDGIDVGTVAAATGTQINNALLTYSASAGLNFGTHAGTDNNVKNVDVSHSKGGAGGTTVGAINATGASTAFTADGVTATLASTEAAYAVLLSSSASAKLSNMRLSTAATSGVDVFQIGASGRVDVDHSTLSATGTGNTVLLVNGYGSLQTSVLSGTTCISVAATGTVDVGPGVDLTGCTTPVSITAGGQLRWQQDGSIAAVSTTGGTTTLVPGNYYASVVTVSGTLTSDATLILPAIAGWTVDVHNNTAGAHNLILSAGGATLTLPSVTQGSRIGVYVTASNAVVQSYGPTLFATGLDTLTSTALTICGTDCSSWALGNTTQVQGIINANPIEMFAAGARELDVTTSAIACYETIEPHADNTSQNGTNALRWSSVNAAAMNVYASGGDANPGTTIGSGVIDMGAGGASAQDTRIIRSSASTVTVDNASNGAATLNVGGGSATQVQVASTGSVSALPAAASGAGITPVQMSFTAQNPNASCNASGPCTPGGYNFNVGVPGVTGSPSEAGINLIRNGTAVSEIVHLGSTSTDAALFLGGKQGTVTYSVYNDGSAVTNVQGQSTVNIIAGNNTTFSVQSGVIYPPSIGFTSIGTSGLPFGASYLGASTTSGSGYIEFVPPAHSPDPTYPQKGQWIHSQDFGKITTTVSTFANQSWTIPAPSGSKTATSAVFRVGLNGQIDVAGQSPWNNTTGAASNMMSDCNLTCSYNGTTTTCATILQKDCTTTSGSPSSGGTCMMTCAAPTISGATVTLAYTPYNCVSPPCNPLPTASFQYYTSASFN